MVFELTSSGSEVRTLQSERINQLEIFPHHDSACAFAVLLNLEVATVEIENISVLGEKKRENSFFEPISPLVGTAIHKQVFAS